MNISIGSAIFGQLTRCPTNIQSTDTQIQTTLRATYAATGRIHAVCVGDAA